MVTRQQVICLLRNAPGPLFTGHMVRPPTSLGSPSVQQQRDAATRIRHVALMVGASSRMVHIGTRSNASDVFPF
jgi:hypothetical protein